MLGIILTFGLLPTDALSNEWAVQYLADTGGSHLIRVPKEEADVTEAYVDNKDGIRLRIRCGRQMLDGMTPIEVTFTIADGNPFLGPDAEFYATFDDAPEEIWGKALYAGGGYNGRIFGDVFSKLSLNRRIVIRDMKSGFETDFPLKNASVAIHDLYCEW